MAARQYSNIAVSTTLSSGIAAGASSLTVVSATGWPAAPFILVIEPDLAGEELILVGAKAGAVFSSLTRGFGGTSDVAHNATDVIKHVVVAEDHSLVFSHVHVPGTDDTAQLSHDDLSAVSIDDHHAQLHAAAHLAAGGDPVLHASGHLPAGGDPVLHASGHLPAGGDAITTAAPATTHDLATANTLGTAESLAKSDHLHALDEAETADLAAIGTANAQGTSEEIPRADHVHEITDARLVAVDGDAVVDGGDVTVTTSFVSGATLSFVMPTGWNTALIVARGTAFLNPSGSPTGNAEVRVEIGASNGTAAVMTIVGGTSTKGDLSAVHQTVVSGNSTLDLSIRKTVGGDTLVTRSHTLDYIAIRAS